MHSGFTNARIVSIAASGATRIGLRAEAVTLATHYHAIAVDDIGIVRMIVQPFPTSEFTRIRPPCFAMIE